MMPSEWLLDETREWVRRADKDLRAAETLSKYAWIFRYPGAPYEPDAEEAARGRVLATRVRSEISRRLPESAFS